MSDKSFALPHLSLLDSEQIQAVHRQALKILSQTGLRVDSPAILDLLRHKLGPTAATDDRFRIPTELVEWAIQNAPRNIQIYDRLGTPAFTLGDNQPRFGIGVTALYYLDPFRDDRLLPFNRLHMQDMVRLGASLPNYDLISTVGILQDVEPAASDLVGTLEMVANTTKPLVILVSEDSAFGRVLDLLETLSGDLSSKPYVIPYLNPVTPLVLNSGTLEKMQQSIGRGLPLIFSSYSMLGMSTPIQPAGTLALLLAELWAGLVVSQLLHPGTPILLGMLPAYFDMQTMISFYDPQSFLLNLACAEIMRHFQIPHCGTSGSGTGWGLDLAALESYWMNHLLTCLAGGSLAPFVGDTLGAKAFSPLTVVYVHEMITQAQRIAQGFSLDEAAFCLSEIDQAGPGGNFLLAPSTLERLRRAYYTSPFSSRWSMEKWQLQGSPSSFDLLRGYTQDLLSHLPIPPDHDDLFQRGQAFIAAGG